MTDVMKVSHVNEVVGSNRYVTKFGSELSPVFYPVVEEFEKFLSKASLDKAAMFSVSEEAAEAVLKNVTELASKLNGGGEPHYKSLPKDIYQLAGGVVSKEGEGDTFSHAYQHTTSMERFRVELADLVSEAFGVPYNTSGVLGLQGVKKLDSRVSMSKQIVAQATPFAALAAVPTVGIMIAAETIVPGTLGVADYFASTLLILLTGAAPALVSFAWKPVEDQKVVLKNGKYQLDGAFFFTKHKRVLKKIAAQWDSLREERLESVHNYLLHHNPNVLALEEEK